MSEVTTASTNTKALASLRIAVGVLFLIFSQYKVAGTQFTLGGGFRFWINRFLEQRLPGGLRRPGGWTILPAAGSPAGGWSFCIFPKGLGGTI
jgi:hypothetical protein